MSAINVWEDEPRGRQAVKLLTTGRGGRKGCGVEEGKGRG